MTFLGPITNPDNSTLKYVRSLRDKRRARYQEKRYLIEGLRLTAHALQRGHRPALAFYSSDLVAVPEGKALLDALDATSSLLWSLSPQLLASIAATVTPQGIVVVMPMPEPDLQAARRASLALVLDRLRDPGNMGTMLRTAHAAGMEAAVLSPGCVDPYSPKVVRAGMGAHLDLPVLVGLSWAEIASLMQGKQCILADTLGEATVWEIDWRRPSALIIGSEAHGPGPEARALADHVARLPMAEGAESLNAAIAMAVFAFEAYRQRHAL
ncbi:MAG: RNA methyltransferase [Chloroflexi bacterium]|nr:RNA methyltransferase [Chloroflexota bacterium]